MQTKQKLDLSVIICTYNRAKLLDRLLYSLARQNINRLTSWEAVIVNNNSNDETLDVCKMYKDKLPLKILNEPRQGKTFALNKAINHASGDLLLFTDDDVRLDSAWVENMVKAASKYSSCGWFGGKVLVDWTDQAPKPDWLNVHHEDFLRGFFVSHDYGNKTKSYCLNDLLPLGANLAIRSDIIRSVGPFRTDLGPRGEHRGVDDETEWIRRAIDFGIQGVYIPNAICWHHMDPERLKLRAYYQYGVAKGQNARRQRLDAQVNMRNFVSVIVIGIKCCFQAIKKNSANLRLGLIMLGFEVAFIWEGRKDHAKSDLKGKWILK